MRVRVAPVVSSGVWRRLVIVADVARRRRAVVHVTGDIHFAVFGSRPRSSVLTVLDCAAGGGAGLKGALFRRVWLRWPARRAGRVVAISHATAQELAAIAGIPVESVDVVPVPIDDALGAVDPPANPVPVLLCFSQTPNKNVERVIEAVAGLEVHLRIIGRLGEAALALLRATGASFDNGVGLTDADLAHWYAGCDLLLFPSLYEGFGMPIVEAQAVGRPVITSARAPMDDVAGGAACLVDPEDVVAIREAVERVLGDGGYREELVRKGFANRERFRPRAIAEQYAQIYRVLAAP